MKSVFCCGKIFFMNNSKKQIFFTSFLFLISFLLFLVSFFVMKSISSSPWDGTVFDIEKLNSLDKTLANPYSNFMHLVGTFVCGLAFLFLPLCFVIYSTIKSQNKKWTFFALILIFFTSYFFNKGFYDLLKSIVERVRPYMYFENPAEKGIANGDFKHSWPSGHTANAFLGTAFVTMNFIFSKDKSVWKKIFIILGYVLSVVTGICRILSGNHFFTDVLSGAILGSLIGYGVSILNRKFGMKISI